MVVFESRNLDFILNADRLNAMIMLLLYFVHVFKILYVSSQARKNALKRTKVADPILAAMVFGVRKLEECYDVDTLLK